MATHGTALSSVINYFRPEFGLEDLMRIIDWMPYIIKIELIPEGEGLRALSFQELGHVEKGFKS